MIGLKITAQKLLKVLPSSGSLANWPAWRVYLPHTTAFLENTGENMETVKVAHICLSMAHYLSEYNHHRDAQAPAQRSFMIRVKLLGEEHVDTLQAMGTIAVLLSSNGKLKEAEEMHTKVVEARIGVLGEEHPDTLKAIDNITTTLHNQGRLKEAEKMETKVVEAKMRVLGEEH